MAKLTRRDRIEVALRKLGYEYADSSSSKYEKFVKPGCLPLWVGRQGAVRCGSSLAKSVSYTDRLNWDFIEGCQQEED